MVDNDHDYSPERNWEMKPILPLSQLGILAILNSKDKSLPVHKITAFLRFECLISSQKYFVPEGISPIIWERLPLL